MRILAKLIFAILVMVPAPAMARDFDASPAMIPYIYRYGACVFKASLGETERRIERCQRLRLQIEENAQEPFSKWHRGEIPRRNRQFSRMLDLLEEEARLADAQAKTVPASVVTYMKCTGGPLINSDTFRSGLRIDFDAIHRVCVESIVQDGTEIENERAGLLLQRLRLRGRVNYILGGPPQTVRFRRGFLGLHRLPSDGGE